MKKLLLISLILVGCTKAPQPGTTEYIEEQKVNLKCVRVKSDNTNQDFRRCENDEVICYTNQQFRGSGLSCHFKNAWAHEGAE